MRCTRPWPARAAKRRRREDEVHLLAVVPWILEWRCRDHRPCRRRPGHRPLHETIDHLGFQPQLFAIRDVLPSAAAADAEVRAAGWHAMRRRTHDLEKGRCTRARAIERHAHALAGNCERNSDDVPAMTRDAVTGRVEVLDVENDLSHTRLSNLTQ